MKKNLLLYLFIFYTVCSFGTATLRKDVVADFETSLGNFRVLLFPEYAPKTVANFVALAMGKQPWVDPRTGQPGTTSIYENTIFHRVIENFMIQAGDPTGTGRGGPGYRFEDEFSANLSFDKEGYLAMANSGPNTNGSQFFITTIATPWLNNHHTIFGKVVQGMDIVLIISKVKKDSRDKPLTDVVLKKITVSEITTED